MAGHYWLSDICQQRIDIVATKNGKTMFSQTSVVVAKDKYSDIGSCLCAPCAATLLHSHAVVHHCHDISHGGAHDRGLQQHEWHVWPDECGGSQGQVQRHWVLPVRPLRICVSYIPVMQYHHAKQSAMATKAKPMPRSVSQLSRVIPATVGPACAPSLPCCLQPSPALCVRYTWTRTLGQQQAVSCC